ncbi:MULTISPECIES: HBL/NHE enterotoxin family protein [unclassified Bacillus (in: firmicutes)]|uniref:non-hemolytic enterotoxin subunit A n=1 Tax=unclassified Bacillus (in: firmicutes) TaxID=185979 RepID=UPI003D236826
MKKTLVAGLLVTAVSTSCFVPVNAFAESKQPQLQQANIQNAFIMNTLSNSIRTLGSQTPLIQGYGLVILKQPDIKVNAMSSLTTDQRIAREHVKEWMDEYNPKLFDLNQEMKGFNTRFTNYYDRLVELAGKMNEDPQAKADFISAFNRLQNQVQTVQTNMERTSVDLNGYKDQLIEDSDSLSKRVNTAVQTLNGANGDVVKLRAEIKQTQEEIQNEFTKILNRSKEILNGSIKVGKQSVDIAKTGAETKTIDFTSIQELGNGILDAADSETQQANNTIKQKRQQLILLLQKLSQYEIQTTQMTLIDDQVGSFTNLIKKQLKAYDGLVNDWKALNETMVQMKTGLDTDTNIDSKALQTQLTQLKTFTDEMNKQIKQYEDFATKIEVN